MEQPGSVAVLTETVNTLFCFIVIMSSVIWKRCH